MLPRGADPAARRPYRSAGGRESLPHRARSRRRAVNNLIARLLGRQPAAQALPLRLASTGDFAPLPSDRAGLLRRSARPGLYIMHESESGDFARAIDRDASCGLDFPRIQALLSSSHYQAAAIDFLALPDAYAIPSRGIVFDNSGRLHEPSSSNARWVSQTFSHVAGLTAPNGQVHARGDARARARTLRGAYVLLHHGGPRNFGHWMMDCLPGAALLGDEIRAGRLRPLAGPLQAWHRQTLAASDVPAERAIECAQDEMVRVERLIVPSSLSMAGFVGAHSALRGIYRAMRARHAGASDRGARLFVARSQLGHDRTMRNEAELAARLAARGFRVVQPEGLPIAEQIAAFADAECVVGAHGSGLFNAVYARPGCGVVEITPILANPRFWIARLCTLMELRYAGVVVDVTSTDRESKLVGDLWRDDLRYSFDADIPAVLRALDVMGVT